MPWFNAAMTTIGRRTTAGLTRWTVLCGAGLVCLGLTGCGGSAPPPEKPAAPAMSPGEECIAAAQPSLDAPSSDSPIEISHILIRHYDLVDPQGETRTREEACLRAEEAREKIGEGMPWEEAVTTYSDAPGPTLGSLGRVHAHELDDDLSGSAFSLDVNELSNVIESKRGFHLILRTE